MAAITVKLFVDRAKNRVVFAESDKDFVDVLLSILTMPMGTIVKLMKKCSMVGCMDNLYQSVENLETSYYTTKACKTMLLHPRNAAAQKLNSLKINLDDPDLTKFYVCERMSKGLPCHSCQLSYVPDAQCPCGKSMTTVVRLNTGDNPESTSGFVKDNLRFMITDNLDISLVSVNDALAILDELGIDGDDLEESVVSIDHQQMQFLVQRSLISETVLTDVLVTQSKTVEARTKSNESATRIGTVLPDYKISASADSAPKGMELKLLVNKLEGKVLHAEANDDFVELLFTFLAFPVGAVVRLFGGKSSMGCVDNLYRSAEHLPTIHDLNAQHCEVMLCDPRLAQHYGSKNQPISVPEVLACGPYYMCQDQTCPRRLSESDGGRSCKHQRWRMELVDPRMEKKFLKMTSNFMLTDELVVTPSTLSSSLLRLRLRQMPSAIEERTVWVGVAEAMAILKASLTSKTALSDAFVK